MSLINFDFQDKCIQFLLDSTIVQTKEKIIVNSPTGSGKTIMLLKYITEFQKLSSNSIFIWLCPGRGRLAEQSKEKCDLLFPELSSALLVDVLHNGFAGKDVVFINWEKVTKKGNLSLTVSEHKNLRERIDDAVRNDVHFYVIIDEEHSNDTEKARALITEFSPLSEIRVSATATRVQGSEYYAIDEREVIESGLITKCIVVNEGIKNDDTIEDPFSYLLSLAESKRQAISKKYRELGVDVNPLVLVQFDSGAEEDIERVEAYLNDIGVSYENNLLAKWLSGDHPNVENIQANNAVQRYLIFKQAIATGWDCPRAKILVKFRENTSEKFEIQTIGRIRRMPLARHMNDELLDYCFLYTTDEEFENCVMDTVKSSFYVRRLPLLKKCYEFSIEKQNRNADVSVVGERDALKLIYEQMVEDYHVGSDYNHNKELLRQSGFEMRSEIVINMCSGSLYNTGLLDSLRKISAYKTVNTTEDGLQLRHCIDEIKPSGKIDYKTVRRILDRLFGNHSFKKYHVLKLSLSEYYAFVINNHKLLKELFKRTAVLSSQTVFLDAKKSTFTLPSEDLFRYVKDSHPELYDRFAYEGYTTEMIDSTLRSTSEILFENYCQNNPNVDWYYKNKDTGLDYFSIVYTTGFNVQRLFYPDYIVKLKNGDLWIIETKGGELAGKSKDYDEYTPVKFEALKEFVKDQHVQFGFVRDKNQRLFLNNTQYAESLDEAGWNLIKDYF